MKSAVNPYGDGKAAIKIIDAIEKYYKEGLLDIQRPDNIMPSFERKIALVKDSITVSGFEKKHNALIHLVYDGDKMVFPQDKLNIKGKIITYDQYEKL